MMQHKNILINIAFQKADEAVESARASIKDGFLSTAQNRIYYAIFYSVMALGYFYDFQTSKHQQLLGWFNKKFIFEEKIFDETLFKIYKEAYENRQKCDYEFVWKPVKEDLLNDLKDAENFIMQIKKYINP